MFFKASNLIAISTLVPGLLMLLAGLSKAQRVSVFARAVADYDLLPLAAVPATARGIIVAEIVLGLLLITGVAHPWPIYLGISLFGAFAIVISTTLLRGRVDLDCGCSSGNHPVSWLAVVRNLALIGMLATTLQGSGSRTLLLVCLLFLLIVVGSIVADIRRTQARTAVPA